MSRRNKIIITALVSAIIALLVLIILLWFFNRQGAGSGTNQPNTNTGIEVPVTLPSASSVDTSLPSASPEEQNLEAGIKAVAATFVERYGSYSNQSNFENLDSLRSLMTIQFRAEVDSFVKTQEGFNPSDVARGAIYEGVTTNVINVKLEELDEDLGEATALVQTQRIQTKGDSTNPRPYYQDIRITLEETSDGWKVDSATWL